jgi:hypothetical protein
VLQNKPFIGKMNIFKYTFPLNTFLYIPIFSEKEKFRRLIIMGIKEDLDRILSALITAATDIEGAAVVRRDGLMITFNMPMGDINLGRKVAAMTAAMVGTSEKTCQVLNRGDFHQVIVEADKGKLVSTGAGKKGLLVVLVRPGANLGLVLMAIDEALERIKEILG